LQRFGQGIPRGASYVYNKVASKLLEQFHEKVANEVSLYLSNGRILDIGCGTGKLLLNILGKKKVLGVGLDISKAMINIAKVNLSKVYGYVDLVLGDAHYLPFKSHVFSLIVSTGTLHHIREPHHVFEECVRVLKFGGEAWIYEFSYDTPSEELDKTSIEFKKNKYLLRLASALHGLPRKAYQIGYIKQALESSRVRYKILYNGLVTKLILS